MPRVCINRPNRKQKRTFSDCDVIRIILNHLTFTEARTLRAFMFIYILLIGDQSILLNLYQTYVRYLTRVKTSIDLLKKIRAYIELALVAMLRWKRYLKYLRYFLGVWLQLIRVLGVLKTFSHHITFVKWINRFVFGALLLVAQSNMVTLAESKCPIVQRMLKDFDRIWLEQNIPAMVLGFESVEKVLDELSKEWEETMKDLIEFMQQLAGLK